MYVIKRNNSPQPVDFNKITERIRSLTLLEPVLTEIDPVSIAQKVVSGIFTGVTTKQLDTLAAETAAYLSTSHPDYDVLASRIVVSNLHKETDGNLLVIAEKMYNYINQKTKLHGPLISLETYQIIQEFSGQLMKVIDYTRDYGYNFFGFKTLEKDYLIKIDGQIVERPQDMLMRVAIGIHKRDIKKVIETYELQSKRFYTHATPTLFNAGTNNAQMSSCFLLALKDDSIEGIYDTLKQSALISKSAGGIGISIHNVRASNSYIRGTNGHSNGIIPMLRVFNDTARYVDQCLDPSTVIYTELGPIPISQCVSKFTKVYTINGDLEVIEDVLEHDYEGNVLEIKAAYNNMVVTLEHPIYALRKGEIISNFNFEFIEAGSLTVGDMIIYPIPKYSQDLDLNYEDCYMYGLILGHGGIADGKFHTLANELSIKYFTDRCIKYEVNEQVITWDKTRLVPFTAGDFGNFNKIHSKWLNLPIEKSKYILKGLFINTDVLDSVLYNDVAFLFLKLGVILDHSWTVAYTPEVCELFKLEPKPYDFVRCDDYLLVPIKEIDERPYSGVLYDLQMKTDHNYLVQQGLVHNGGGKRKGAFAVYLEPWHADIEDWLELKKNIGKEEMRCRDLFYGLWVPDLFMKRVESNDNWSLFCPNEAPNLFKCWGKEFEGLYCRYEAEGRARKVIKAVDLFHQIVSAQIESGQPYMLYKDSINAKSNQKNLGTIRSSNLCTEIMEYTDEENVSVCNLSSIALPMFLKDGVFDHQLLFDVVYKVAYSLDCIIDNNFYPIVEAKNSNFKHRPIGIGIQGAADLYCMLKLPFDSQEAMKLNKEIFETIYFAAASSSCDTAKIKGAYSSFIGSPASEGILCPDMWGVTPSDRWDFEGLRSRIKEFGLRNSLLVAPMPTASTSQILGNNECFEPFTTNIYARRVLAGEFVVINKHLVKDLIELGLWNLKLKNEIVANNGSVQNISSIPEKLKLIYRTAWEIKTKPLIDMAADRAAFIDQSQSFNIFMANPNRKEINSMHFYGWKKGLKTGMYYLRTRPGADANKVTVDREVKKVEEMVCMMDEGCLVCGS